MFANFLKNLKDKDDSKNKFKRKVRPAQKLFEFDSIQKIGGMPMKEKENWIFENNRYTPKGFLIKNFPLSTVVTGLLEYLISLRVGEFLICI